MIRRSRVCFTLRFQFSLLAIVVFLVAPPPAARAAWPMDPAINVPICTAPGGQGFPLVVPDGQGGAIIGWTDFRNPARSTLYAERVTADGDVAWAPDGVPLIADSSAYLAGSVTMIADGQGGAIVAWIDGRSGYEDVYAQRVSAAGVPLWAPGGVVVCAAPLNQADPVIAPDGSGGVIAVWVDIRSGDERGRLFAQRIGADGTARWVADGVPVSSPANEQVAPRIVADGAGGAMVQWVSVRTDGLTDLLAQRLDGAGQRLWGLGAPVCDGPSNVSSCEAVSDGAGGLLAFFDDDRNVQLDLFAQRVDGTGARQWGTAGVPFCDAPQHQQFPRAVSDGKGGAFVTWDRDYRAGLDSPLVQSIGSDGVSRWDTNGIPFTDQTRIFMPALDADTAGGLLLAWQGFGAREIWAQRLEGSGDRGWGTDGVVVSEGPGFRYDPRLVSDGAGGAIVVWMDFRTDSFGDVYAQRVPFDAPTATLVQRAEARVSGGVAHVAWWLSESAGRVFEVQRRTTIEGWRTVGRASRDADRFVYEDRDVLPGIRYGYRLAARADLLGEVWADVPEAGFALVGSWPNPARDGVLRIALTLEADEPARLEIFDLAGRRVATRTLSPDGSGSQWVEFGTEGLGAGVYLARLTQGRRAASTRLSIAP